jgi:two-component system sensor histidine kinase RegB
VVFLAAGKRFTHVQTSTAHTLDRAAPERSPTLTTVHTAWDTHDERARINLSWIVHLHWWGILGQAVVVVGADAITGIELPVATLAGLLVLEVVGNFALGAWARRVRVTDASIAAVMFLDVVVLTVLLDLTGGAVNPFATLYLVNVALAAVLLPPRWSWALMAASLLGFASLFVHEALVGPNHHVRMLLDQKNMMKAHLHGMWVACALAAIFVVFFVQRVSSALAEREMELQITRAKAARREKLASLATLAAGAAHELATPLSTIAVVAKELERSLASGPDEVRADLRLVREQVARCREILDRMAAHSGENVGESLARLTSEAWIEAALDGLSGRERVRIERPSRPGAALVGPPRALGDALRGLLKNALQASGRDAPVTLRVSAEMGRIRATVQDQGKGMPPEILARVGEPFFTTKGPGEGMGLGLFLTRALAEQLGGEFHIASRPGAGTEAWIDLPAADAGERSIT